MDVEAKPCELDELEDSTSLSARLREVERELKEVRYLHRRTRRLVDMATDSVLLHDAAGRIIDANQHACDALGYTREEMLELSVYDVEMTIADMPKSRWGENWNRMQPGVPVTVQGEHRRKDGSTFPVEVRLGIIDVGDERFLLALARDVSERNRIEEALRESEERLKAEVERQTRELRASNTQLRMAKVAAEQANAAKSRFIANMSHELRTPLNATIGYAELVQEELEDRGVADLGDDLDRIGAASRHLLSIIDDILDISKIEAGRMALSEERVDLATLVSDAMASVRPMILENGNELETAVAPNLGHATLDGGKLRQTLVNLLANAAKFTQDGRVTLSGRRAGTQVRFVVEDTGIGMSKAQLARVFEPFTQADASTTRRFGGTGLGLAISRSFCELMGGALDAESSPGEGTRFTLTVEDRAGA